MKGKYFKLLETVKLIIAILVTVVLAAMLLLGSLWDRNEIGLWILSHGGSVEKRILYDEEGVDGWTWCYDDKEFTVNGDWNGVPPVPNDLVDYFNKKYPKGI